MDLNEGLQKINQYILSEDYRSAYDLCNKLLLNFPESRRLNKLQRKIEKIAFKQNVESVKKDMKALKPLWEEKEYGELVKKLEELLSFVPGYRPVEKDLYKAKKLYQKQLVEKQKIFLNQYMSSVEDKMSKSKFREAIILLKKVSDNVPRYKRAKAMIVKAKELLVNKKLKENKDLLKSKKFNEIEKFLKGLLEIDPNNAKVKSAYKRASKRESIALEFAKKDFTYQSYEEILILYQKKKYEKAIDSLYELLSVDPENQKAKDLLAKAESKFDGKLTNEVVEKILELQKKYEAKYKNNKKDFISI